MFYNGSIVLRASSLLRVEKGNLVNLSHFTAVNEAGRWNEFINLDFRFESKVIKESQRPTAELGPREKGIAQLSVWSAKQWFDADCTNTKWYKYQYVQARVLENFNLWGILIKDQN